VIPSVRSGLRDSLVDSLFRHGQERKHLLLRQRHGRRVADLWIFQLLFVRRVRNAIAAGHAEIEETAQPLELFELGEATLAFPTFAEASEGRRVQFTNQRELFFLGEGLKLTKDDFVPVDGRRF
jgi:hypothetical protein